jgi:phosphoenolpyruvate carboxylase
VLLTKRAIANYHSFAEITGIKAHPIIEASTLMFRGGLNPDNVKSFYETYPGARSATITPSFRFDHDLRKAQEAIEGLNKALPKSKPLSYTKQEAATMKRIESIFIRHYTQAINKMPDSENIVRVFENKKQPKKIHSSLRRSFALYSLGVPPELIGAGRALIEVINSGLSKDLEQIYPTIKQDLVKAGALLNKENLKFLAKTDSFWAGVIKDVELVQDYTDSLLGPDSATAFMHRNHTSNVFHSMSTNREFSNDLLECARLRRSLG